MSVKYQVSKSLGNDKESEGWVILCVDKKNNLLGYLDRLGMIRCWTSSIHLYKTRQEARDIIKRYTRTSSKKINEKQTINQYKTSYTQYHSVPYSCKTLFDQNEAYINLKDLIELLSNLKSLQDTQSVTKYFK